MATWFDNRFKNVDSIKTGSKHYCTYNCGGTYGDNKIISTSAEMLNYELAGLRPASYS
ncbi:hypothetical protein [Emticicia sp. 21SJ11W-3]|uniref:hypothetical protein n=1 Tax=Emticicia sp. 21SJ11W-3 TaxID=2916755 RepID=UPI0020A1ED78|nr:hypothetical protein [Emticicia sp. 21SJ11W-3]UTA69604.1 hypothetical protein MB380_07280 [Emticicia sp. 21SJ11W-3]